jgi:VWFA-related protein
MKNALLLLPVLAIAAGCQRSTNPLLATPSASVTSVTMHISETDTSERGAPVLFIALRDNAGNPIQDVTPGNFTILEDGKPTIPTLAGPSNEPLSIVMVIDRSGSMASDADGNLATPETRNDIANVAGADFVAALDSTDQMALVEFDDTIRTTVDFTSNKTTLTTAINAGAPGGSTALYDAVITAANLMAGRSGRRFVIVLSDGDDTASSSSLEAAIDAAQSAGVSVYTVVLGSDANPDPMAAIASNSNADSFVSTTGSGLSAIFLDVLNNYHNLIYLQFRKKTDASQVTVYFNYGSLTASATRFL